MLTFSGRVSRETPGGQEACHMGAGRKQPEAGIVATKFGTRLLSSRGSFT